MHPTTPRAVLPRPLAFALLVALTLPLVGIALSCNEVDPADMELASSARIRAYFNYTGTSARNGLDPEVDDMTIQMIDRAEVTIDFAIMGFSRRELIDALLRAHHRGVRLRFVGDARHLEGGTIGYEELDRLNIPSIVGNQFHIMHNKFFVIDHRFVVTGTGNITTTGYTKNNNNYVLIDDPYVAADFTAEFDQMFSGRFGANKVAIENGNTYEVGDTTLEVYFSPQQDAIGRILEGVESATHSLYFTIFAFTKDQVGSAIIAKHLEFSRYNRCCSPANLRERLGDEELTAACKAEFVCEQPFVTKEVRGLIDKSQLHSNGPYHEAWRMLLYGVPMRLDGNDNSFQPGDYQAGGGRLHSKTMVIDAGLPTAKVLTGSFNWSSSATIANDETFLVLNGTRITDEHAAWFEEIWALGKRFGNAHIGEDGLRAGDIIFNEVQWDGYDGDLDTSDFGGDDVSNDEFIELLNTTGHPIDLSMWVIGTKTDFTVGFYPGTIIGPYERFLILDHNLPPFSDLDPQVGSQAFKGADFVLNGANDARFIRLNLRNAAFFLRLIDPDGNLMDLAGDGGAPFAGGRRNLYGSPPPSCSNAGNCNRGGECLYGECVSLQAFSMERVHPPGPGDDPASWKRCEAERGGINVVDRYKDIVIATPGEPNSIGDDYPAEQADFRSPTGN